MIKKYYIVLLIVLPVFLTAQEAIQSHRNSTIDSSKILIEQFQTQTETWKTAYNSTDANQLVPLYTEDAVYCSSHVHGLVAQGREEVIANFQRGMSMGGHIDTVTVLSVQVSCDLATLFCKYVATNAGQTAIGLNLLVLKKIDARWLIVTHMTVI